MSTALSLFPEYDDQPWRKKLTRQETLEDYDSFVAKFYAKTRLETPDKHKMTTDDCYTPEWNYNAIIEYIDKYVTPLDGHNIVRPFWPGNEYRAMEYKPDDIVIDNPPFSILASIVTWYCERGIKFWLWGPTLTLGNVVQDKPCTAVVCSSHVTYHNGAEVNTSYVTNLYGDDRRIMCDGRLNRILIDGEKKAQNTRKITRRDFPINVVSAARLDAISHAGEMLVIRGCECKFIRGLERSTKTDGRSVYGGGWLLSDNAAIRAKEAKERAFALKAEREAKERDENRYPLSENEFRTIARLNADSANIDETTNNTPEI